VTLLVLFDLDGTLFLTSDSLYGEALERAVREAYGRELTPRTDHAGTTAMEGLRMLLRADGLDDADIDRGLQDAIERLAERYLELLEDADTAHWELAPDTVTTLEALAAEHRLALLTGNPEAIARARIERLGIARFFPSGQGAFGSDGEHRPDLVARALERAGGWPTARTILVGDTPRDVAGAHEAGVKAVGVTSGGFDAEALRDADAVIDSLAALPAALQDLGS
jgi:phosphoglycolate phosphatase